MSQCFCFFGGGKLACRSGILYQKAAENLTLPSIPHHRHLLVPLLSSDPVPAVRPPVHVLAVRFRLRGEAVHPMQEGGRQGAESHQATRVAESVRFRSDYSRPEQGRRN